MPERFEKKFKCIDDSCDGQGNIPHQISEDEWEAQQCQFHAEYLFPLKKLIQSEIDLAVAKKEKEIVESIEQTLELSCVDDRLLGKTDEYLEGYNTSTERWRQKRDELINLITTK